MNLRSLPLRQSCVLPALAIALPVAATAQVTTPVPSGNALPGNSLVVDPQQGATPRPITPVQPAAEPLPSTPTTALTPPASTVPAIDTPAIPLQPLRGQGAQSAQTPQALPFREGMLPQPSANPLNIDPATDPILRLAIASADPEAFHAAIRTVVERNPSSAEVEARRDEALASRNEARAGQYPVIDLSLSYFRVLDREFSNDPRNILERSRPRFRTDSLIRVQQPILDFGTSENRIRAGNRRLEASIATIDDVSSQIALRGVAVWYQLFGYRALASLAQSFVDNQTALRSAIQARVKQGYAAPADVAQVESYIAAAQTQLASYRRQVAQAEASYAALTGAPAPQGFGRAPAFDTPPVTQDRARADAETIPAVKSAKLVAEAARYDAKGAKSNALPGVTAGIDAGRYGLIETARDYDIRGSVTLSQRIGGGAVQRIAAAQARARGQEATYERVRQDAVRDAGIAWSDVEALRTAESAIRDNYLATRQSRDVLAERFRVARGTLFDLLSAETNYFNVAARYVETVTELDIARYTLLARRGKLLDAFGIAPARLDRK